MAALLLFTQIGCDDRNAVFDGKVEEYNQLAAKIDQMIELLSLDASSLPPASKESGKADPANNSKLALELADDMAYAQFFDLVTDDMLVKAGDAVKAYPHPLLLNNYASLLDGRGKAEEALFFFQLALNQDPDNPVLLTNAANVYIELDDFEAAQQHAKKALLTANDFGPAYQILTTVHLKNEHSELAAETMVKSAKHSFNEITMHHFDSFLDAVADLDPEFDAYPLKEPFLDELYAIARTNVDTKNVNNSVDTPAGQIRIKPFPTIGGADHLMKSQHYLTSEGDKITDKWNEARSVIFKHDKGYYKHLNPDYKEGVYPIVKNVRQIYAYKILESYYTFQMEKIAKGHRQKRGDLGKELRDRLDSLKATYKPQVEEAGKTTKELTQQMFADILSLKPPADPNKLLEAMLHTAQLEYNWKVEDFNSYKQNAESLITDSQKEYNETKQLLEEFWLKSGGLIKYIANEDVFHVLNAKREMLVYDYIGDPLDRLVDAAGVLISEKNEVFWAEQLLEVAQKNAGRNDKPTITNQVEKSEGEDLIPDFDKLERESIETYPEIADTPDVGFDKSFFGFSGSVSSNGDAYEISGDAPLGLASKSKQGSFLNNTEETKIVTMYGIQAELKSEWFRDKKTIEQALKSTSKMEKLGGILGKINMSYSASVKAGEYETNREGGGVVDRGKVYVKETTVEVGPFKKTEKVEITKPDKPKSKETGKYEYLNSRMTAVAEKKKTVKYTFMFGSLTLRN